VPSLANSNLHEIENLASPERQKQEEIIKRTLGSMFLGASLQIQATCYSLYGSGGIDTVHTLIVPTIFFSLTTKQDRILDDFSLSCACPLSRRAKESTGRA
jgi:hypothetical protein